MKKLVLALLLFVAACGTVPQVETKPDLYTKQELVLPEAKQVIQDPVQWHVINKDNAASVVSQQDTSVVYALTPDNFQKLITNESDLRRYIQDQQNIIAAYKKYYDEQPSNTNSN